MEHGRSGRNVLGIVLAGGQGTRLLPLTADRAKPAVPFGGIYRLIDFVLSNLVNAGYLRIVVLTQYKSSSLDRHITTTWRMSTLLSNYIIPVPAQQRMGERWYLGSADAILQNLNLISDERPDVIAVFGADHIYRMDPSQMVREHIENGAGATVAGLRVPIEEADQFGVIETEPGSTRIARFLEKPKNAVGLPDAPHEVFASMGNYVFDTECLIDAVKTDAEDGDSAHDMGGNIIPNLVAKGDAHVYDFSRNDVPGASERDRGYWRDVGTLDAYYDAHLDLISPLPVFNLYNRQWPILTIQESLPPAKFVYGGRGDGMASDSLVCNGAIVSGGHVRRSVVSPGVRIESGADVDGAVLMHNVVVGPDAVVRNAIVDKNVVIPAGMRIGVDPVADAERWTTSRNGIVVIKKNSILHP